MTDKPFSLMPTIIVMIVLGLGRLFTGESERGFWTSVGAFAVVLGVLWLISHWYTQRAIRFLTRLDADGRRLALANIMDQDIRREIERALDEDRLGDGAPPVERFAFPRRMSRRLIMAYVGGALVALGGATLAALTASRGLRLIGAATALVAAVATIAWGWWRSKLLASVIEISPFAISEVSPDGSRRTLLWRDAWWLRNRPRLERVEVLSFDRQSGIFVHYDRVAFKRAAELIVDYGGFRTGAE